jgi:hypothetical protein
LAAVGSTLDVDALFVAAAALKVGGLRLANIIRAKPAAGSAGQLQDQQAGSGPGEGAVVARIKATAAG